MAEQHNDTKENIKNEDEDDVDDDVNDAMGNDNDNGNKSKSIIDAAAAEKEDEAAQHDSTDTTKMETEIETEIARDASPPNASNSENTSTTKTSEHDNDTAAADDEKDARRGADEEKDENSSSSSSDEEEDDDDDEDSSEDDDENQNNDGLSDYERLRLERIKRNQERLAALGLQGTNGQGVLGGVKKKNHHKKKKKPPDNYRPSRTSLGRSSKKRIDYAELPKLHDPDTTNSTTASAQKNKKEKTQKHPYRKKEKKHNDRVPLFVYQEFQRMKSKRRIGFSTAKKHKRKADREVKYWSKMADKLTKDHVRTQNYLQQKVQARQEQDRRREQAEQERNEYGGYTRAEKLSELEHRGRPKFVEILTDRDRRYHALVAQYTHVHQQQSDVYNRQQLDRKVSMMEAMNTYPKSYNEALATLNTKLARRVQPSSVGKSAAGAQSGASKPKKKKPKARKKLQQQQQQQPVFVNQQQQWQQQQWQQQQHHLLTTTAVTTALNTRESNSTQQFLPQPIGATNFVVNTNTKRRTAAAAGPVVGKSNKRARALPTVSSNQRPTIGIGDTTRFGTRSAMTAATMTNTNAAPLHGVGISQQQQQQQQQQQYPYQQFHHHPDHSNVRGGLSSFSPGSVVGGSGAIGGNTNTNMLSATDWSMLTATLAPGSTPPSTHRQQFASRSSFGSAATALSIGGRLPTEKVMKHGGIILPPQPGFAQTVAAQHQPQQQDRIRNQSFVASASSVLLPSPIVSTKKSKKFDCKSGRKLNNNNNNTIGKKSNLKNIKGRASTGVTHSNDNDNRNNTDETNFTTMVKKQITGRRGGTGKTKDARYVGGWMSPHFAQELERSWLERTKPLPKTIVVPNKAAKLATVKKTAVFDLQNYVPQVGDIVMYYPSAHKDFLKKYPDTLGSRQRNVSRVPLWARANRERNRLSRDQTQQQQQQLIDGCSNHSTNTLNNGEKEQEKGKTWWTDAWIDSLYTVQKSKKERELEEAAAIVDVEEDSNSRCVPHNDPNTVCISSSGIPLVTKQLLTPSLGDYPIICRVERTYNEFPDDPYSVGNSKKKNRGTSLNTSNSPSTQVAPWSNALDPYSELAKVKRAKCCPRIRLAVSLKALSPVVVPDDDDDDGASPSPYRIELPPNFTVTTCPVDDPSLESFLIPFSWGYTAFHTLSIGESVWIQRSVKKSPSEDDDCNTTSKSGRNAHTGGKGKIIDFNAINGINGKSVLKVSSTTGNQIGVSESSSRRSSPLRPKTASTATRYCRLENNIDHLEMILLSLDKGDSMVRPKTNQNSRSLPSREINIIISFLSLYLENLKSRDQNNDINPASVDTGGSVQPTSPSASTQIAPGESSSMSSIPVSPPMPLLIALILKTLPLRRSVSVTYDSNRRQLYRTSSWNLVTLQPTDLSQSIQDNVVDTLDNSMRERAIFSINNVIHNNPRAQGFIPIVTELMAPGYSLCVPIPMSLDRILSRLKPYGNNECYYVSMESILGDVALIQENALLYNHPDSDLVAHCSEIVQECQQNMKDIMQHIYPVQKAEKKGIGSGRVRKNGKIIFPFDLNLPYEGKVDEEWLKQITADGTCAELGKRTRHVSASSTWIPQVGDTILYSRSNHARFVDGHRDSLDVVQCILPHFQTMDRTIPNSEAEFKDDDRANNFSEQISSHWIKGTVVSVRSSFPKDTKNQTFTTITPILIIELKFHYAQCESDYFISWRPCVFPNLENSTRKSCELFSSKSFLIPAWMSTEDMQIIPSNTSEVYGVSLNLTKDTIDSIGRCFDFLKHRCIEGISPDAVDASVAMENATNDVTIDLKSHAIPSYLEFFDPTESIYTVSRPKKKQKMEYQHALDKLSDAGYMPLWRSTNATEGGNPVRHESWMPFPRLCIELIRLRIISGHYRDILAIVNDISESYMQSVIFLISSSSSNYANDCRRITKFLNTAKGSGKIAVKKKAKKSIKRDMQAELSQNNKPKIIQESVNEKEEVMMQRIFQIRKYHAAAIVFTVETNLVEKLFCLKPVIESPLQPPKDIPDVSAIVDENYSPEQLNGIKDIRNFLNATRKDRAQNLSKFQYRHTYKIRIKCGGERITQNGIIEINAKGPSLFQPAFTKASLPDGSQANVQVRCGNKCFHGEKRPISYTIPSKDPTPATGNTSQSMKPADSKSYPYTAIGQQHLIFSWPEFKKNEELARSLFGRPGRMFPCIRCQLNNSSFLDCRVRKYHSNQDYDFNAKFKGSAGVDSMLIPWKQTKEIGTNSAAAMATATVFATPIDLNTVTTSASASVSHVGENDEAKNAAIIKRDKAEKEAAEILAKEASEARECFVKIKKASELADYLYHQADLLKQVEIKLSEYFISTNFPVDPEDNHYTLCIHCGCAGELLLCDGCSNVAHRKCIGLIDVPEDEDWFCHKCVAKNGVVTSNKKSNELQEPHNKANMDSKTDSKEYNRTDSSMMPGNLPPSTNVESNSKNGTSFPLKLEKLADDTDTTTRPTTNQTSIMVDDANECKIESEPETKPQVKESVVPFDSKTLDSSATPPKIGPSSIVDEANKLDERGTAVRSEIQVKSDTKESTTSFDSKVPNSLNAAQTKETAVGQMNRAISPEINDSEFDLRESELNTLLTELINKRAPEDIERKSQDANLKQTPIVAVGSENKHLYYDPLDSLGDSSTWIRQFLSFISIKSAEQLLNIKSGLIVKDLIIWRREKEMHIFADSSCNSMVSMWKNTVRKAHVKAKEDITINEDNSKKVLTDRSLQGLPKQAQRFCLDHGIKNADHFLSTENCVLTRNFSEWRKRENMPVLPDSGNENYIGKWERKLRRDIEEMSASNVEVNEASEEEDSNVEDDEAYEEEDVSVPPGFQAPIGYKIRKLFDDGDYYNGEVTSGPTTFFDEERQLSISVWMVRYEDDDQEEFTARELEKWSMKDTVVEDV